jgi:hypothetical protein
VPSDLLPLEPDTRTPELEVGPRKPLDGVLHANDG